MRKAETMNTKKRLVMEIDFYDNALNGYTQERLERLFEQCAESGIDAILFSTCWSGRAEYHSKILPLYSGKDRQKNSSVAAEIFRSYDPLAAAVKFGKKYRIAVYPYIRLHDEYWPGWGDENIDRMEHGWWESRCGQFKFKGWPCYSNPEIREYKLNIIREIASYGADGLFLFITRTHAPYLNIYHQPDFFGYNPSIADEYYKRYGVNIRQFDCRVEKLCCEGYFERNPLLNEIEYVGAADFDRVKWHELKGEAYDLFFREVRKILGPDRHLGMECTYYFTPQSCLDETVAGGPAVFAFDIDRLAREKVINEWIVCGNWRSTDFDNLFFPRCQAARDTGVEINMWLNDLFSPTGGDSNKMATPKQVEAYLKRFRESRLNSATIHEAAFLDLYPEEQVKELWTVLKK
jgi:hypothetical protein